MKPVLYLTPLSLVEPLRVHSIAVRDGWGRWQRQIEPGHLGHDEDTTMTFEGDSIYLQPKTKNRPARLVVSLPEEPQSLTLSGHRGYRIYLGLVFLGGFLILQTTGRLLSIKTSAKEEAIDYERELITGRWDRLLRPEWILLMVGLPFGVVLSVLTPPFQSPDEFNHFFRSFEVSEGRLHPEVLDGVVGGELPADLRHFADSWRGLAFRKDERIQWSEVRRQAAETWSKEPREFFDLTETNHVSFLAYTPQAIGIAGARWSGGSLLTQMQVGRLVNLGVTLALFFLALRLMPILRWSMLAVCLIPTGIFLYGTLSYDALTNALAFLFLAMVLRLRSLASGSQNSLGWGLGVGALFLGLFSIKFSYFLLFALIVLVPPSVFRSAGEAWRFFLSAIGLFGLGSGLWFLFLMGAPTGEWGKEIDRILKVAFCVNQPDVYLVILGDTLAMHWSSMLADMVGLFGWIDTELPPVYRWLWLGGLVAAWLADSWDKKQSRLYLSLLDRALLLAVIAGTIWLIFLIFFCTWNSPGERTIQGFQGRYLIPVVPLLLVAFHYQEKPFSRGFVVSRIMAVGLLAVALFGAAEALSFRFWE